MKILIATKNPGKIEGAKRAFSKYFDGFEIIGVPVSSDVSDEPVNDEILQGAKNRVKNLKKHGMIYLMKNKQMLHMLCGETLLYLMVMNLVLLLKLYLKQLYHNLFLEDL